VSCLEFVRLAGKGKNILPTTNDPVSDLLARIRNALIIRHATLVMPSTKVLVSLAAILKREGYIENYEVSTSKPQPQLRIHLLYRKGKESAIRGLKRVSKPGLRVYVGKGEIPRVYGGIGTALISTSLGMMTGGEAWRKGIGGELVGYVW